MSSQYLAALEMLKQTISQCPVSVWDSADDKTKFWHIAYHALFYTHLYLQDTAQTFTPWRLHRRDYQFLGRYPWPPHDPVLIDEPYDKATVLDYLTFCQQQVAERMPALNMEAPSGFDWLPFNKLELQIYNIRHLQQHAGELMERLGTQAGIELDWVAMKRG
ncbi:MAG: DinB family protein [Chloroflexi bacterium]|nr:DinB family protein [Chloroflexota bacterium]MCL5274988.1 DinB family protein [Chloroflexota bacterium]